RRPPPNRGPGRKMRRMKRLGIAAVVLCAVLALLLHSQRSRRPPAPAVAQRVPRPPKTARPPAAAPAPAVVLPSASAGADSGAAAGLLAGEVRSTRTGALVPGAQLVLERHGAALTVPAPEGRFRFAPPAPGDYPLLTVEAPGFQPFAPALGQSPIVFRA